MITSDRSTVVQPPCPRCGAPVDIEYADVTTFGKPPGSQHIATALTCPADPHHDTRKAWVELEWPGSLTEDDRAWLRKYANPVA